MLRARQRGDPDGRASSMEAVHGPGIRSLRALLHQREPHLREDLADGKRFDTLQGGDQLYVHFRVVQGRKSRYLSRERRETTLGYLQRHCVISLKSFGRNSTFEFHNAFYLSWIYLCSDIYTLRKAFG